MIYICYYFSTLPTSSLVVNPLCFYGVASLTGLCVAIAYYFCNRSVINLPKDRKFSITQHFFKVPFLQGIKNISAFQKFNSRYDFLRQTFFHNRYVLIDNKSTKLYNGIVYNLAVTEDESYITELGITHNCRCTVVEVAADKYTPSNSKDAIEKGMAATTEIGKNGKNRIELFRFNAGKEQKLFPPKMPYNATRCADNGKLSITGLIGMPTFVLSAEKSKCEASKIVEEMRKDKLTGFTSVAKFKNNGEVKEHYLVDKKASDYKDVKSCCYHFAKQGSIAEIMPRVHFKDPMYKELYGSLIGTKYEGKCPDFRVNGLFYELEGFEGNRTNKLSLMLTRGLKQSSRLVLKNDGSSLNHALKLINFRKNEGQLIDEVLILNRDRTLTKVY